MFFGCHITGKTFKEFCLLSKNISCDTLKIITSEVITSKLHLKIKYLLFVLFSLFDSNSGSSMLDWRESQRENSIDSILIRVELKSNFVVHERS